MVKIAKKDNFSALQIKKIVLTCEIVKELILRSLENEHSR